ncbi:hypothetical protein ACLB2K_053996 [Fragaria x ananassa]
MRVSERGTARQQMRDSQIRWQYIGFSWSVPVYGSPRLSTRSMVLLMYRGSALDLLSWEQLQIEKVCAG